jgi:flagellar hook-basal body complex protein FliE
MSAGIDKTLSIKVGIEQKSFDDAKIAIQRLIDQVRELSTATAGINLGGGGPGFMSVTGVASGQGQRGSVAAAGRQGAGGQQGGGMADQITKAVQSVSTVLKASTSGSSTALKGMKKDLHDMVDASKTEVDALTTKLVGLESTFKRLSDNRRGKFGLPQASAAYDDVQAGKAELGAALGVHGSVRGAQSAIEREKMRDVTEKLTGIRPGGARGADVAGAAGGAGGAAGGGGGFGSLGGGLKTLLGAAGFGALAGGSLLAAGIGAANFGLGAVYDNRTANLQYGIGLQSQTLNRQATYGQIYGGNAVSLSQGDVALSHAMLVAAAESKDKYSAFATATGSRGLTEAQKQKIDIEHPTELDGVLLRGGIRGLGTIGSSAAGKYLANGSDSVSDAKKAAFRDKLKSGPSSNVNDYTLTGRSGVVGGQTDLVGNIGEGIGASEAQKALGAYYNGRSKLDIENAVEQNKLPEMVAQRDNDALMKVKARNPLLNSYMQDYYNSAMGDMSIARMARVSGGLVKNKAGEYIGDAVTLFQAEAEGHGWDAGQKAGMIQQIGGQVGWGAKGVGAEAMLSKQYGGLSNAVDLAAIGHQFGGKGGEFVNALAGRSGMVGSGGLDTSAGARIFGAGAGMMGNGSFAGNGLALMQTLGAAGSTGTSGGDMWSARAMQSGLDAGNKVLSGGLDPLQKGLNASAAMKAAPDASYITHAALMGLDQGTMMAALKDGVVPTRLSDQGITIDILRKYRDTQNGTAFARYSDSMGTGTEVGKAVARYKASGGNMSYMKGMNAKDKDRELEKLGIGMERFGGADTADAGIMRARNQASEEGILSTPKGKGAFAVAASGPRLANLLARKALLEGRSAGIAKEEQEHGGVSSAANNMEKAKIAQELARLTGQLAAADTGTGGAEGALAQIEAGFKAFMAAMRADPQILAKKQGGKASKGEPPKAYDGPR